jgi:hypothetical protein
MSNQSEAVKRWRKRSKEAIIESMGGECTICGYNTCTSSLALHHIDPTQKDHSFGGIRANPKKWDTIAKELRKCCLVCHNCHSEIHSGLIPEDKITCTFDESYVKKNFGPTTTMSPCPVCAKPKPEYNITCSRSCSAKRSWSVDWSTIDVIKMVDVDHKTFNSIGTSLGISGASVGKRYKKLKKDLA